MSKTIAIPQDESGKDLGDILEGERTTNPSWKTSLISIVMIGATLVFFEVLGMSFGEFDKAVKVALYSVALLIHFVPVYRSKILHDMSLSSRSVVSAHSEDVIDVAQDDYCFEKVYEKDTRENVENPVDMTLSKKELVACAIWMASQGDDRDISFADVRESKMKNGSLANEYDLAMRQAEAVINELLEPSPEMIIAGCIEADPVSGLIDWRPEEVTTREDVVAVYKVMVREILTPSEATKRVLKS